GLRRHPHRGHAEQPDHGQPRRGQRERRPEHEPPPLLALFTGTQLRAQRSSELGARLAAEILQETIVFHHTAPWLDHSARRSRMARCTIVPTLDSVRPVNFAMARLVRPAPYLRASN